MGTGGRSWALVMVMVMVMVMGVASAGVLGCRAKESEAVAVARSFAETARRGDVAGMHAVLERSAVEQLEGAAETASDQVGGRRSIEPKEMLQIVGVDRTVAVAGAELLDEDGEIAHVELTMTDGRSVRLELVWEQEPALAGEAEPARAGGWKVRIPVPAAQRSAALGHGQTDA